MNKIFKNYYFEFTFIDGSKSQQSCFAYSHKEAWQIMFNTYFDEFDYNYLSMKILLLPNEKKELLKL